MAVNAMKTASTGNSRTTDADPECNNGDTRDGNEGNRIASGRV